MEEDENFKSFFCTMPCRLVEYGEWNKQKYIIFFAKKQLENLYE